MHFYGTFDNFLRLAHLILSESLSTSFIAHPQTRFGRLILKEAEFGAVQFIKATCQYKALFLPLKSPPSFISPLSLWKCRFPLSCPSPLTLGSGLVHNQLGDYSNQVINYWRSILLCHALRVLQSQWWQPGWVMLFFFLDLLWPSATLLQLFSPHPDRRSFNREQRHTTTSQLQQITPPTHHWQPDTTISCMSSNPNIHFIG